MSLGERFNEESSSNVTSGTNTSDNVVEVECWHVRSTVKTVLMCRICKNIIQNYKYFIDLGGFNKEAKIGILSKNVLIHI